MTIEASQKLLIAAQTDRRLWQTVTPSVRTVLIVKTSWYPEILSEMEASAKAFLTELHIPESKIRTETVSGSWELPLVVEELLRQPSSEIDFVLALGCVVRGSTPHFDILCPAVTTALMDVQLRTRTPVGFGVLTVNTESEARERANKGAEAAEAALRTWVLLRGNK